MQWISFVVRWTFSTAMVPVLLALYLHAYELTGLDSHNYYRWKHQAHPMQLDSTLSAIAQNCSVYYAQKRTIDHSCTTLGVGENLYSLSWGSSVPPDPEALIWKAAEMWHAENEAYDYIHPEMSTGVTGHFTQLVWNSSTMLGLGIGTVGKYTVVVAKYYPQGNTYSYGSDPFIKFLENVFPPSNEVSGPATWMDQPDVPGAEAGLLP